MGQRAALLVVDVQNDFCPGGALGVPQGDAIIPRTNRTIALFQRRSLPVIFTRDWHPKVTKHFKEFGGAWPPHCIQAFTENGRDLESALHELGVDELFICGLATDYCVRATTLDGLRRGMTVRVLRDAIRGVEVKPGDSEMAVKEMRANGAHLLESRGLAKILPKA